MRNQIVVALLMLTITLSAKANSHFANNVFVAKDMLSAKLNPSGEMAVSLHARQGNPIIRFFQVANAQDSRPLSISDWVKGDFNITRLAWVDNEHLAIQLHELRNGIQDLADSKKVKRLIIVRITKIKDEQVNVYSVRTKGWLVSPLQQKPGVFLYAKSGLFSKVYTIQIDKLAEHGKKLSKLERLDGGQFRKSNELAKVEGYATKWFVDATGKVTSVLHYKSKDEVALTTFTAENGNIIIASWKKDETTGELKSDDESDLTLFPVSLGRSNKEYFCIDLEEENERSVYKVDFEKDSQELVYKSDAYKVVNIEVNADRSEITVAKVLNNGKIEYDFLTQEKNQNQSMALEDNVFTSVISESEERDISIVYTESFSQPGEFYLSTANGARQLLGSHYPDVDSNTSQLVATVNVNGLAIPYILNLPKTENESLPMVVMPHGGPIGIHDSIYFDKTTQFLVSNGFAVLRVNFRGSSGYSEELELSGKKAFTNLMLEDIYAATQQVVSTQPVIDSKRICSFGASYGGYAALMLAIDYPEQFKCAASWAGVTDVSLYLNSVNLTRKQLYWATEHIAHAENEYDEITSRSPAYNTEKISAPVLVAHGINDRVVDVEHAYRMKLLLETKHDGFEWYLDDESGHNFTSHEKQRAFFEKLSDFLHQHI